MGHLNRLAYFEWSALVDPGPRPDDPAEVPAWEQAHRQALIQSNPALGIRLTEDGCDTERGAMLPEDYARERLGIFPDDITATEPAIDPNHWTACAAPTSKTTGPLVLAFEVSLDRRWAQIGVASTSTLGGVHVEIIENRRRTGWVIPRLLELQQAHSPTATVCNPAGPAGGLLPEAVKAGLVIGLPVPDPETGKVTVKALSGRDYTQACQAAFDDITEHRWRHINQAELDVAVGDATKRTVGDAFVFDRRGATDISPFITVTLAAWAHGRLPAPESPEPFVIVT